MRIRPGVVILALIAAAITVMALLRRQRLEAAVADFEHRHGS